MTHQLFASPELQLEPGALDRVRLAHGQVRVHGRGLAHRGGGAFGLVQVTRFYNQSDCFGQTTTVNGVTHPRIDDFGQPIQF